MRVLLLPFSWLFAGIIRLRNLFFDKGIVNSVSYSLPVISVGNITVGGTGKTPLTEYIIRTMSESFRCALLSRGYGRKTKGAIVADDNSTYADIGDEPMQIKAKFDEISVVVSEKRKLGIEMLLKLQHPPDMVVMDDAFQHRYVKPNFSILVMDYFRPIWKDFLLPAGNLREPKSEIKRAEVVIVNKCPNNLSSEEATYIKNKLKLQEHQQLFFTSISYKEPVPLIKTMKQELPVIDAANHFQQIVQEKKNSIIAVAGIGNPIPFFEMIKSYGKPIKTFRFKDHHRFTIKDINKMVENSKSENSDETPLIITTEKDAVRIKAIPELNANVAANVWYIPIELIFLFNNKFLFDKILYNYVRKN